MVTREVDGSLQKVPRPHGKLREGPSDAQKADRRSVDVLEVDESSHVGHEYVNNMASARSNF